LYLIQLLDWARLHFSLLITLLPLYLLLAIIMLVEPTKLGVTVNAILAMVSL
jgi:hypothetical protein